MYLKLQGKNFGTYFIHFKFFCQTNSGFEENCTSNIYASRTIIIFNTGLVVHKIILNPFDSMAAEYSPLKNRCRHERFISTIDCGVDRSGRGE